MARAVVAALVAALTIAGLAPAAAAQEAGGSPNSYTDVPGGVHGPAIEALAALGVFDDTECGPRAFCPGEEVQRWTMAVWLVRVLDAAEPPEAAESSFADVDADRWWLAHVQRLAELEVTKGCATDPLRYCGDRPVTRAQMATFLVRAFNLEAAGAAGFTDIGSSGHEASIDALAAAGITAGCAADPPRFCGERPVTRAQMATLLARASGLVETPEPAGNGAAGGPGGPGDAGGADMWAACRPPGVDGVTAGFPLPNWAAPTVGTMRVAVLFIDFADAEAAYSTQQEALLGLPYAEAYLEVASYDRLDVEFAARHGWLRAGGSVDDYLADTVLAERRVFVGTHAIALADPGFDYSGYHTVMVVLPSSHFSAGDNTIGGVVTDEAVIATVAQVNSVPRDDPGEPADWGFVAAHELAHSLGLADLYPYSAARHELPEATPPEFWATALFGPMGLQAAFRAEPNDRVVDVDGVLADGRQTDGYTTYLSAGEMLAWSRWQLGWLDESQVRCVAVPEATVTLGPVAGPGDAAAMAVVPLSEVKMLVVESRRKAGYDAERQEQHPDGAFVTVPSLAAEGVLVYTVDASVGSGELPMALAGDRGNGRVSAYPILARGDRAFVGGYTVKLVSDDGGTHTVEIFRGRR